MGGAILQTSGATILTPGTFWISSTRPAGNSLKTGAGASARITISPAILDRVLPINERIPWVRLKSPRIATIGIVRPTTARSVLNGRVIKFSEAKRHLNRPRAGAPTRAGPENGRLATGRSSRLFHASAIQISCRRPVPVPTGRRIKMGQKRVWKRVRN